MALSSTLHIPGHSLLYVTAGFGGISPTGALIGPPTYYILPSAWPVVGFQNICDMEVDF